MSTVLIWFLAAVGVVQAGLSVRAYLLEKREGLPRSSLRAAVSVVIALGILAMGAYETVLNKPAVPQKVEIGPVQHTAEQKA